MAEEEKPTDPAFDMAAVSIQSRILPFWREHPRLWFAQYEALVEPLKTSDEQKYRYVLGVLQPSDIQQIGDLLLRPPPQGKYTALKTRLLSVYEESEDQQFQRLVSGLELGDQKPTQLLRRMRELGGTYATDDALKVLWMNQLPIHMRAVLAVNTESSLDTLAIMADKMREHTEPPTIAAINRPFTPVSTMPTTSKPAHTSPMITSMHFDLLSKQLEKLSLEIAELRSARDTTRHRRPFHSRRRSRSRSSTRRSSNAENPDWLCYYHHRFGDRARRCESPCAKRKRAEN